MTCSITECGNRRYARGWCRRHYYFWQRNGSPLAIKRHFGAEEQFKNYAHPDGECLVWHGRIDRRGYGCISIHAKMHAVHRYAWERANGQIPDGMMIDHRCHNTACVNVKHLRLATPTENARNKSGANAGSRTGVRNVYVENSKYRAQIVFEGRAVRVGLYDTIAEAASAAEQKRAELFGEFAGNG